MSSKVLICTTLTPDLRSECVAWSYEDSSNVLTEFERQQRVNPGKYSAPNQIPVGLIPSGVKRGSSYAYPTVLHALGDGWRLLAPPQPSDGPESSVEWDWWLDV